MDSDTRTKRIEQRKILGDYYRQLSQDYDYLWHQKLSWVWPDKPNVPDYENA